MFPIEMFPKVLRPIIKCTPIYVVTYGPAKLLINFSFENFIQVFIAQIIYLVITIILTIYTPINKFLKLTSLSFKYIILAIVISFISVFWYEIIKVIKRNYYKK